MGWFKQSWKNKPSSTPEKVWSEGGHFLLKISVLRWPAHTLGGVCIHIIRWVVLEPREMPVLAPPHPSLHSMPLYLLMAALLANAWNFSNHTHTLQTHTHICRCRNFASSNGRSRTLLQMYHLWISKTSKSRSDAKTKNFRCWLSASTDAEFWDSASEGSAS